MNTNKNIYQSILASKNKSEKLFSVLIDPDKFHSSDIVNACNDAAVDFILIGGSLLTNGNLENCIKVVKKKSSIPVILFPGGVLQIHKSANGILLLSLISGRNPDMLIGKHIVSAPLLRESNLEILPTGYILIESGNLTTVAYMSNTNPIPADKDEIAVCTALAGEMLGLKLIYLEAGSGAKNPVSERMIKVVKENISVPLIVGGGIQTPQKALAACRAGADMIVVGNAIEKDISLVKKMARMVHSF
ncbi:MAG: geranylgeranylglyceryl/heptaprenylglyceryl phosphate synthase [Bacteroidota bacterium]